MCGGDIVCSKCGCNWMEEDGDNHYVCKRCGVVYTINTNTKIVTWREVVKNMCGVE